ncbi:hypothetical protein ACLB2K_017887 [Fragaria x ananassa]
MKLNSSSSSSHRTAANKATSTGAAAAAAAADDEMLDLGLGEIKDKYRKWNWKGQYAINYVVSHPDQNPNPNPNAPPVLLVHGFGASIPHWRSNDLYIASFIFERVRQRESLRNILSSVYANKESVDDELVEIIMEPTNDPGALDAFVSIVTGPPGPNPVQLIPGLSLPILVLWGDEDPFTPLDGPVGKYFSSLPSRQSNVSLSILQGVGHCPHDDRPKLVHDKLLPWLADLST